MSRETMTTLNNDILIGFQEVYGKAWHYDEAYQGSESNHYTGAIPVEDVYRRIFDWEPIDGEITVTALTESGVLSVTDPERKAILRSDTGAVLGIFKKGYQAHPYKEWLVQNVETILSADLAIGRAGLLRKGGVAFVQVEMKETLKYCGVEFRPFLTAATSLDGTLATTYIDGATLSVCDNTLSAALQNAAHKFRLKHTKYSLNKILEARDALDITQAIAENFEGQLDALLNESVSDSKFRKFATAFAGPALNDEKPGRAKTMAETKFDDIVRLWSNDARITPWKNTAFGVVQSVNTYAQHISNVRGASRIERNLEKMVKGDFNTLDRATLDLLATV